MQAKAVGQPSILGFQLGELRRGDLERVAIDDDQVGAGGAEEHGLLPN